MKKYLGLLVMTLVALLPFTVNAATSITPVCGNEDADGFITCSINYNITDTDGATNLTVTLTEQGGADIDQILNANDSDWTVSSSNESNGVWTVLLAAPSAVSGEGTLFQIKYKASGLEDCSILVKLNDVTANITPQQVPADTPVQNEDTGAALPYIALGTIVVIAVGAYFATKNKSKMYKI